MCSFPEQRPGRIRVSLAAILAGVVLLTVPGCGTTGESGRLDAGVTPAYPRFYLEGRGPYGGERSTDLVLPVSGTRVAVDPLPVLVEMDIRAIEIAEVGMGRCLRFELMPAAAKALHRISLEERGSRLVLVLDDRPVGVRVIDDLIQDGYLYTFLEVPDESLPVLVESMRAAIGLARR